MPSFLCESLPTGQYTSYVPDLSVRVSVVLAPGWITAVSCSIPCPSTSKACGMLPAFVTVNVTLPAGMVPCDSSTFHSDNLALTAAERFGSRCAGVPATARAANRILATFRDEIACMELIRDLPPERVRRQCGHCRRLRARQGYSAGNKLAARGVFS